MNNCTRRFTNFMQNEEQLVWVLSQFLACLTKENSHRKSNELYNDEKKRNFSLKLNFKPSFFLSESWTEVTKITKQSFIRVLWDEKWSSRGKYSKKRNPRKECWKEKQKVSLHSWWISSFLSEFPWKDWIFEEKNKDSRRTSSLPWRRSLSCSSRKPTSSQIQEKIGAPKMITFFSFFESDFRCRTILVFAFGMNCDFK